jgi:LysR family transcriptional regulator, regulator for bpeEF and oprC
MQKPFPLTLAHVPDVGTFPRRLFAPEGCLAMHKRIQDPADLAEHPCIRFVYGEPMSQWDLRREREHRKVKVSGPATSNSVGMTAKLSKEGMGIAIPGMPSRLR